MEFPRIQGLKFVCVSLHLHSDSAATSIDWHWWPFYQLVPERFKVAAEGVTPCRVYCLVTKSCLTLLKAMDCSPPGSSVHGISQARILEWFAISFSRGSSWPRDWTHVSCISRRILYHWATREALVRLKPYLTSSCFSKQWSKLVVNHPGIA